MHLGVKISKKYLVITVVVLIILCFTILCINYHPKNIKVSTSSIIPINTLDSIYDQRKFIRDQFGKYILIYGDNGLSSFLIGKDSSIEINLAYSNGNPADSSSWIKNIKIADGSRAFAFLVSSTELHVIHTNMNNKLIFDEELKIERDSFNNIIGIKNVKQTVLDNDIRADGPKGVLTHDNKIIAVWSVSNSNPCQSFVRSLKYTSGVGWTNMNGSSTEPDQLTPDYCQTYQNLIPFNCLAIEQNPINKNIYVVHHYEGINSFRLIKAKWNGNNWIWEAVNENFTDESDSVSGNNSRSQIFRDPYSNKLLITYQSSFDQVWDSEQKAWYARLRVISIDENDVKMQLGPEDLDKLPRASPRSRLGLIVDKQNYYLFYPSVYIAGKGGSNLLMITWNGSSWGNSQQIDSEGSLVSIPDKSKDSGGEFVYLRDGAQRYINYGLIEYK